MPLFSNIPDISASITYNLHTLKVNPWGEIAGALGDLGTFLPLLTALTAGHQVSLGPTLIFTGMFNIITGAVFGIPIAVQPMKAIASVALSRDFTLLQTMGAGLTVALIILFLSITQLLQKSSKLVPIPVIKGIQVGVGLSLLLTAGSTLSDLPNQWYDNIYWSAGAFVILYGTSRSLRFPFALYIFLIGIAFAFIHSSAIPKIGINLPSPRIPFWGDIQTGFFTAGIGQLPLTVLNSIIAVNHLSTDLLPSRPAPSVTALGLSVGIMNIGCLFGSMPVCHGSGGLAAQHRFGARSGAGPVLLGTLKLLLGLLYGDSLAGLLGRFPKAILGVLVFAAGMELLSVGSTLNTTARDLQTSPEIPIIPLSAAHAQDRYTIMTVTAGALVAFRNDFVGFLAGMGCFGLLRLQDGLERRRLERERRENFERLEREGRESFERGVQRGREGVSGVLGGLRGGLERATSRARGEAEGLLGGR